MGEMRYITYSALEKLKNQLWSEYDHSRPVLIVCIWDGDKATDAINIFKALEDAVTEKEAAARVDLREVDSRGLEDQGPLVMLLPAFEMHTQVTPEDCPAMVDELMADYQARMDFFPEGSAGADGQLPTGHKNKPYRQSDLKHPAAERQNAAKITPTLSGTLLGAYVLATRRTAGLFGKKENAPAKAKSQTQQALEKAQAKVLAKYDVASPNIVICAWDGKCAADALPLYLAFKEALEKNGSNARVHIKKIDASGFNDQGPLVLTLPTQALYVKVRKYDAEPIVRRTMLKREVLEGLLYRDTVQEEPRTLTLEELAAMAANEPALNQYLEKNQSTSVPLKIAAPETLPLLEPFKLRLRPRAEMEPLHLTRLRDFSDASVELLLHAAGPLEGTAQDGARSSTEPSEEFPEEAALFTVSELFSQVSPEELTPIRALAALKKKLSSASTTDQPGIILLKTQHTSPEELSALSAALKDALAARHLQLPVIQSEFGVFSDGGPLLAFAPCRLIYAGVTAADIPEIIQKTVAQGEVLTRLLVRNDTSGLRGFFESEIPFHQLQTHLLTENLHFTDSSRLSDALQTGAFAGLAETLSGTPEAVIQSVKDAGLRGRGGAGFPTWQKLQACATAPSNTGADAKYVVGVIRQEDPLRDVLAANPFQLIEGITIGAYACGASKGVLALPANAEYLLAAAEQCLSAAREQGLLGQNILDSSFAFDIQIFPLDADDNQGEATALLQKLMGSAPIAHAQPPYPSTRGLNDQPTVLCHAQTWLQLPLILRLGTQAYAEAGSSSTGGTFLASIQQANADPIFAEVRPGMKLRLMLQAFAGIQPNSPLKALQLGKNGALLPMDKLDVPFDYASTNPVSARLPLELCLQAQPVCLLQLVLDQLRTSQQATCGICLTCRAGLSKSIQLLSRFTDGTAQEADLVALKELAEGMRDGAMCSAGREAVTPLLSLIRSFPVELDAHLNCRCPGGRCPKLTDYLIDSEKCTGCGECQPACPVNAIEGEQRSLRSINLLACVRCGACLSACPHHAISFD